MIGFAHTQRSAAALLQSGAMVFLALAFPVVPLGAAPGALDETFDPGSGANNTVWAVAVQQDGNVLIGGTFTNVNGQPRYHIARLNSNGSLDASFAASISGFRSDVFAVAVQSDQKILVGGNFSDVNGQARGSIARLHADGTLDTGFMNGLAGMLGGVSSIAVRGNGKVLAGGAFSFVNGASRNGLVQLNEDGSTDIGFEPTGFSTFNPTVTKVIVQDDGKALIAGTFTSIFTDGNYEPRISLARFNLDGSLDTDFSGLTEAAAVGTLALQPDGKVLIGGIFTAVNGVPRGRIARLNANGSLDSDFLNGLSGANGGVRSIVVQSDGKILVGGEFSLVNGTPRSGIARLNSDGSLDTGFLQGLAGVGVVCSMVVQHDSGVLLGGMFTSVHGVGRNRVARLQGDAVVPRFVPPIRFVNGVFEAGVEGSSGVELVIHSSTNLVDWLPVHTNSAPFLFMDSNTASQAAKSYRATPK